jgi:hypothetical protein
VIRTYSTLPNRALDQFARRGIDADGAGAVDCVVCYDCLGEDVWRLVKKKRSLGSALMFVMLVGVYM